jgi:5-(aminomethyl)-3-furanmethanol phosphate kinase
MLRQGRRHVRYAQQISGQMIVVKLGGSLLASGYLLPCLDKVEQMASQQQMLVVPGGGEFAGLVRRTQVRWQFDDRTAHQMAILAMQQTALLYKALKPNFYSHDSVFELRRQAGNDGVVIWSPDVVELDNAGIPSTWAVTSDSLSAWLAKTLVADELILVKSVKIDSDFDILNLVQKQIVDAAFHDYSQHAVFKLKILHAETFLS